MSSAPQLASQTAPAFRARANSLANSFQDAITVILRVRYRVQRVADAVAFRTSVRSMISAGVQEARRMGYSDQTSQMALYAIIGFLDESVLSSGDPTFQNWAQRPLQEEMFGGHFAGEYFFRHVAELLNQPESAEVADALELHAICLLLGYRGKYAFGENGEIRIILQRVREKIARVRGPFALYRQVGAPPVAVTVKKDPWIGRLAMMAIASVVLLVVGFAAYWVLLNGTLHNINSAAVLMLDATWAVMLFVNVVRLGGAAQ